ncbi:Tn3 family transposase [Paraburkholderia madseniana]|uniref:Tn3 family transposase n=1 Tax=Paraburkholderia madseniana TaxID=2599607 RepID=UPI0038B7DA90
MPTFFANPIGEKRCNIGTWLLADQQSKVTASRLLRKFSACPRQSRLAAGLREFGRTERTLFQVALGPGARRGFTITQRYRDELAQEARDRNRSLAAQGRWDPAASCQS